METSTPTILPTFTFNTFKKSHLGVATHEVGLGNSLESTPQSLVEELEGEGIEIFPYEQFFSDGEPPKFGGS
jgi:hypothetical protein